ncbi:hypothetical protein LCM02_04855 [Lutimonas saemankumensis]|uniref:hypothetical protein n=1 Tax=Lutimonas saemankumensis TaxID=483016 RepID=UPI001CD33F64|nr:hypothetical protein [Lutimonas saemankumensis]MCA0931771.1 hypothetical protein [Lutimonas saemankumensis]
MKSYLLLLFIFFFNVQTAQSQVIENSTEYGHQDMYDFYMQKHKKLRKTGYILLGAGAGAMLTGWLIGVNSDTWSGAGSGALIMTVGAASSLASIPVFIVANSNKREAQVILNAGKIGAVGLPFQDTSYASVGLKISF